MAIRVGHFLHTGRLGTPGRATQELDLGVGRIESWLLWWQVLFLGVRLVRVPALLDGLGDARRIPFGILDLLLSLDIRWAPDVDKIQKRESGIEGAGCLQRDLVGLDDALCSVQCLLGKLFDIGLGGSIIDDGVLVCVLGLGLLMGAWVSRGSCC